MIGIAMVGTNDMRRARAFYDALMPAFGAALNQAWTTPDRAWDMTVADAPMLAITTPFDGRPASAGNGSMVVLVAPSNVAVDTKALALGGIDEGAPGHRSAAAGDLYGGYVRDADGNKVMVFATPSG